MQDFANPNETLRTQTVLNALGYTGPNGETVPETGQLDENTLYAWYRMRSDRDPFRSFSQEMHDFLAEVTGQNRIKNRAEYVIARNKENILAAAEEFEVDPQTLAACVYTEQRHNINIVDSADFPLFFIDTSIGISQVKVSTAEQMEDMGYIERTEGGKSIFGEESPLAREYNIAKRLLDEKENIRYAAAYLKYAQDQWINAFPEIKTRPDILATLYNQGWGNKPPHSSPGANDFGKMAESYYARMGSLLELDEK
ncbi:MAG: DUF1402 family protein [Bacillota bacterium]|nr:DUF1402 family protein [Bacillota bacterium]